MIALHPTPVLLTEESEKNLDSLRRALRRAHFFSLFIVVADGRAKGEVRDRLQRWSDEEQCPRLTFLGDGFDGVSDIWELLSGERSVLSGVVISNDDMLTDPAGPAGALNLARDRLWQLINGPLLILAAPQNEVLLSKLAADLFDCRVAAYEVRERPRLDLPRVHVVDLEETLERVESWGAARAALLEKEASPEAPPANVLADDWLALAMAMEGQLRHDEALIAASETERLASLAGYLAAQGAALRMKSRIQAVRGELDEAEKTLAQAFAVASGDRDIAMAWWQKADFLAANVASRDEAFRVLTEKVIPGLKTVGEASTLAKAAGKAAELLELKGDIVGAIGLRADVQLPALERIGASRRVADVRQTLNILRAWRDGDLDAAIMAFQQGGSREVLARMLFGPVDRILKRLAYLRGLRVVRPDLMVDSFVYLFRGNFHVLRAFQPGRLPFLAYLHYLCSRALDNALLGQLPAPEDDSIELRDDISSLLLLESAGQQGPLRRWLRSIVTAAEWEIYRCVYERRLTVEETSTFLGIGANIVSGHLQGIKNRIEEVVQQMSDEAPPATRTAAG